MKKQDHLLDELHYRRLLLQVNRITIRIYCNILFIVTVCVICAIAKWREVEAERRKNAWIDKSEFWTDFFYNQFSCSGVGIASIIVGLIFV